MKKYIFCTIAIACLAIFSSSFAAAQPGTQGGGNGRRSNDMMNLLRNESVKKELELVDDQVQEIDTIMQEMWAEMRERMGTFRDMRDLPPEERKERYAKIREEMDERRGKFQEEINKVLLPNQLSRLKQINVQSRARRYGEGAIGVLKNKELLEELGIDEETQEKLEKKTEEVLKELQEKVEKLKKKAEEEILSVLPSDKKKAFRELVGESFSFGGSRQFGQSQVRPDGQGRQERRGRGRQDGEDKK